jgi:hypothetical protein
LLVGITGATAVETTTGVAVTGAVGATVTFTATKGATPGNSYVAAAGSTVLTRPITFAAATTTNSATPGST